MTPPIHILQKEVENMYKYYRERHKIDLDIESPGHSDDNLYDSGPRTTERSYRKRKKGESDKLPKKKRKIDIDSYTEEVIRVKIAQYYTDNKVVPTINTLRQSLKEDGVLDCGYEFLRKLLHRLDSRYKNKCQTKKTVDETAASST